MRLFYASPAAGFARVLCRVADPVRLLLVRLPIDGFVPGQAVKPTPDGEKALWLVDLKTSDASEPYAYLRLGRQELVYGAQRYVSPDDWRNVRGQTARYLTYLAACGYGLAEVEQLACGTTPTST